MLALVRVVDSCSVHWHVHSVIAVEASEMSFFDFRYNASTSDDDSSYLNKLIYIIRTKVSLKLDFSEVVRSNLNHMLRVRFVIDIFE